MSIENAILELAAAIRYHADKTAGGTGKIATLIENVTGGAEIKTESAAKPTNAKAAIQQALEAAIPQALEAAKADKAKETPAAAPVEETDPLDDAGEPLDWDKDVKPVLGKITDKAKLVALLGEFGAKNGGELKAMVDKFPAVLVAAKKVLGE